MTAPWTVLALGSNAPHAAAIFAAVRCALEERGWGESRLSPVIRTAPVDCAPGTPDFFNAVLVGRWRGGIRELFDLTRQLEVDHGRPRRHEFHAARTLDIDLILWGDRRVAEPDLSIPHPHALERDFVLRPLRAVAPELEALLRATAQP